MPIDNVVGRAFVVSWPVEHWAWLGDYPEVFGGVPDRRTAANESRRRPDARVRTRALRRRPPVRHRLRRGRPRCHRRPGRRRHGASIGRAHVAVPEGLRDSKLLSEKRREVLAPVASAWVLHSAVGLASAEEVDAHRHHRRPSVSPASARSGLLHASGVAILESRDPARRQPRLAEPGARRRRCRVVTRVKADRDCGVGGRGIRHRQGAPRPPDDRGARDDARPTAGRGTRATDPPAHYAAIDEHGPSALHRRSWLKSTAVPA